MTETKYLTQPELEYFWDFILDFEEFHQRLLFLVAKQPDEKELWLTNTNALLDIATRHERLSPLLGHPLSKELHSLLNVIPVVLFPWGDPDEYLEVELDENWHQISASIKESYVDPERLLAGWTAVYEACFGPIVRLIGRMKTEITLTISPSCFEQPEETPPTPLDQAVDKEIQVVTPLTPLAKAVDKVIQAKNQLGDPIIGTKIVDALHERDAEKFGKFTENQLTAKIVPELKDKRGLLNMPRVGYYYSKYWNPTNKDGLGPPVRAGKNC